MSIPERLWRVAKGHWDLAKERIEDVSARADAYQELADALKQPSPPAAAPTTRPASSTSTPAASPTPAGHFDPLDAAYELLKVQPGTDLAAVEAAYQARITEIRPEQYAEGSVERAAVTARRAAVEAAYQKVRDALNPTETRFERLEF